MTAETFAIVSGSVTFGVPCAIVIWSVVATRRDRGGSWRPGPAGPTPPTPKPLPDCLIPKRAARPAPDLERIRELA